MNNWNAIIFLTMIVHFIGLTAAVAEPAYLLDSGDKISINVYDEDMDVEVRLSGSGSFKFPYIGLLIAKGKSVDQLVDEITRKLQNGYLVHPQVRVRIEEYRPFYVNGEIRNPGSFPYQQGLTLRRAISLAGGYSDNADEDKVFVVRDNVERQMELNAFILPGDIITVEQSFFFINGEVQSPGKYAYKSGLTIRMAVSLAGGFTERASESNVVVQHEANKDQKPQGSKLENSVLAGDIITVKQSFF